MKAFDRKFGAEFLGALPASPGVYMIHDKAGTLIYIGKARSLRRRLGQYRNAKRRKKHAKMRSIIREAAQIEIRHCDTDLAACLLETELIQRHRPRWNVAGAFHFLYPMIALRRAGGVSWFAYTTTPEVLSGCDLHGAYRSREITGEAFFALMRLLKYVGHSEPPRKAWSSLPGVSGAKPRYTYVFAFRQLPETLAAAWAPLLRGESLGALEELVLQLLENAAARMSREEIQDDIRALKRFWRHEAQRLARARKRTGQAAWPVPQSERDSLFLKYRYSFRVDGRAEIAGRSRLEGI